MFCPKCGTEYQGGITKCADCDVDLVLDEPKEEMPEYVNLVTVYETGSPAVISIAKTILSSENIPFHMKGDGVQDLFGGGRIGTGFNVLVGPVQVQVDEKHAQWARELLSDLEASEVSEPDQYEEDIEDRSDEVLTPVPNPRCSNRFFLGLMIGVLIAGAGFFYYSYSQNNRSGIIEYDRNNDSQADLFYKYEKGRLIEVDQDRNFDGKNDHWTEYESDIAARGESDDDFDGLIETAVFYENGLIDRVEIDANLDSDPEIIEYYTNDVLDEMVYFHERTHKRWKEVKYAAGIIKEELIDTDHDGDFDLQNIYNASGRLIGTREVK
jgi:hypothetical protein